MSAFKQSGEARVCHIGHGFLKFPFILFNLDRKNAVK